jgi:hypothetical protein
VASLGPERPVRLAPLIGREHELRDVLGALDRSRLLS